MTNKFYSIPNAPDSLPLLIRDEPAIPRHAEVLEWINALILDLKLIELGEAPRSPITMERLNEWSKSPKLKAALETDTTRGILR